MRIIFSAALFSMAFTLFIFGLSNQDFSEATYGGPNTFDKFSSHRLDGPTKFSHLATSIMDEKFMSHTHMTSQVPKVDNVDREHSPTESHTHMTSQVPKVDNVDREHSPTESHTHMTSQVPKVDNVDREHSPTGSHTRTTSQVPKVDNDDKIKQSNHKIGPSRINEILQIEAQGADCSPQFFDSDDSNINYDRVLVKDSALFKNKNEVEKGTSLSTAQIDDTSILPSYPLCN